MTGESQSAARLETEGFAVETLRLTRRFGDVTAVDGLSLQVRRGELFGFVGPDGAGKTTTLRMLASILDPSEGSARVLGLDTARDADAVKDRIGYMSQRFGLYADLTAEENLIFYADIYGVPRGSRGEAMERLLGFSGLLPFKHRRAGNLSGGMKQKLGLACALIHTPQLLLLDEPTNGVDPVSRRDFWRILTGLLREGVTVIAATAYLDEAERFGRLALLHRGKLLACGTPREVKGLMRGRILEVRAARPREARPVIEAIAGKGNVSLFGDRLHVVCDDPAAMARNIRSALAASGAEGVNIVERDPGLEDVFISRLGPAPEGAFQTNLQPGGMG